MLSYNANFGVFTKMPLPILKRRKHMKKVATRILCLALILVCLLAYMPQSHAAQLPGIPNELFLTQNVSGTCTLCSAAMMVRNSLYLHGNSDWSSVTENVLRRDAWVEGVGLKWNFSHKVGNTTVKVGREVVNGVTIQGLKNILDQHPEGVVLYCGKLPHAVFLTGYDGDVFYCADTVKGISGRQITLKESWLGIKYGSQAAVLKKVTAYWYVSSYIENGQDLTCQCDTKYAGTYIATSSATDLRIRAGHGSSYAILGTIPYGAKVTVLRATGQGSGNWAHIIYNGISGYAAMGYLKQVACTHLFGNWTDSAVAGQQIRTCTLCGETETRQVEKGQMGTITGSDLRIRAGAGTGFSVVGYLQKGDRVEILETKQVGTILWGRTEKGWISMGFVKLDMIVPEPEPLPDPEPEAITATVTTSVLRIRKEATTASAVAGYYQEGDRVEILETKQVGTTLWGRTEKGWISMAYVELDPVMPEPEPEPEPMIVTVTTSVLRIRKEATTASAVAGYYQEGDRVEILETKQVGSMLWGRTEKGWISMDYVR